MKIFKPLLIIILFIFSLPAISQNSNETNRKNQYHFAIIMLQEVDMEIPLKGINHTLKIGLKTNYFLDLNIAASILAEFRIYRRKTLKGNLNEGSYLSLPLSSPLADVNPPIINIGFAFGTKKYFGKKDRFFFDAGAGLKLSSNIIFENDKIGLLYRLNLGLRLE